MYPHGKFVSTYPIWEICDKYEVWVQRSHRFVEFFKEKYIIHKQKNTKTGG